MKELPAAVFLGILFATVMLFKHQHQLMNCSVFNQLPPGLKQETLLSTGTYLADRAEGLYNVMLYEMGRFYVEVYRTCDAALPKFFRSFRGEDGLEPYIQKINLDDLLTPVY